MMFVSNGDLFPAMVNHGLAKCFHFVSCVIHTSNGRRGPTVRLLWALSHWILWKGPTFQCMDNIDMRLLKMHIYTNFIYVYIHIQYRCRYRYVDGYLLHFCCVVSMYGYPGIHDLFCAHQGDFELPSESLVSGR